MQQKGGAIGDFEGVIWRTDLGTALSQERGASGGFLKGDLNLSWKGDRLDLNFFFKSKLKPTLALQKLDPESSLNFI